jgi:hypothetical protein
MSSRLTSGLALAALLVLSACGARTEILGAGERATLGPDSGAGDAAPTADDAATACGGSAEACCAGTGCGAGLACNGGTCTVPGQASLVLFGGHYDINDLDDTWVLHGSRWTRITVPHSPPARGSASMATLGSRIVLFGGGASLDDTWIFDGTSWSEVSTSERPTGRYSATMTTLGNEVVLFGCIDGGGNFLTDTWTFDGSRWAQVNGPGEPPTLKTAAMAPANGEAILFGQAYCCLSSDSHQTWAFDGLSWRELAARYVPGLPGSLQVLAAATLGSDVVVFGQTLTGSGPQNTAWTFDGSTWSEAGRAASTPPAPVVLQEATLVSFDGKVVLVGGQIALGTLGLSLRDLYAFDGSGWSSITTSNPPSARLGATVAVLP